MFPESVRAACEVATDFSINSTKSAYKFSCNASWIFFTSSMILFAPVLFETERAQMIELERSQKQQVWQLAFPLSLRLYFLEDSEFYINLSVMYFAGSTWSRCRHPSWWSECKSPIITANGTINCWTVHLNRSVLFTVTQ